MENGKTVLASADEILSTDDLITSDFDFRGKWYRVRELSAAQSEQFAKINNDKSDKRSKLALVAQQCLINEDGSQMFTEDKVSTLAKKSLAWLKRVQDEVLLISGLTKEAQAALGEDSAATGAGA